MSLKVSCLDLSGTCRVSFFSRRFLFIAKLASEIFVNIVSLLSGRRTSIIAGVSFAILFLTTYSVSAAVAVKRIPVILDTDIGDDIDDTWALALLLRCTELDVKLIVVLWSDHGWHLGEKLITGKNSLWKRSTRVPLIFAGPGIVKSVNCGEAVELLDIDPTQPPPE